MLYKSKLKYKIYLRSIPKGWQPFVKIHLPKKVQYKRKLVWKPFLFSFPTYSWLQSNNRLFSLNQICKILPKNWVLFAFLPDYYHWFDCRVRSGPNLILGIKMNLSTSVSTLTRKQQNYKTKTKTFSDQLSNKNDEETLKTSKLMFLTFIDPAPKIKN